MPLSTPGSAAHGFLLMAGSALPLLGLCCDHCGLALGSPASASIALQTSAHLPARAEMRRSALCKRMAVGRSSNTVRLWVCDLQASQQAGQQAAPKKRTVIERVLVREEDLRRSSR